MLKTIDNLMAPDWAASLHGLDPDIDNKIAGMGDFLRDELRLGYQILPSPRNIFRAFSRPLSNVKVLIVGQDPYPTPGHPVGLSFSVAPSVHPLPKSLQNIFRELVDDMRQNGDEFGNVVRNNKPEEDVIVTGQDTAASTLSNGDLTPWFNQGVMLMNRALTVRAGSSNSHAGKGWEEITEDAVRVLAGSHRPLVAILWGRNARSLAPLFQDNLNTLVIESAHPSPLSANGGFFGSHPFSRANRFLIEHQVTPIKWVLP